VPVPGGTTTFVLDGTAPVAAIPVADSASVPKTTSASFPTFIAETFASPTTIGLYFDVVVHLSANLSMNSCADVSATVERVDTAGVRSLLGSGGTQTSIPQGGGGGTTGFAPVSIQLTQDCAAPIEDVTIGAGESIAVTVSVTNRCNANRTVFLAYDATSAPSSATFAPLPPPDPVFLRNCFAKCQLATSKATAKFFGTKTKCIIKCELNARKGYTPFSDCFAPYAGATNTCITDPLKGAESKTEIAIRKVCTDPGRCPTCYSDGNCNDYAIDAVQNFEGVIDSFIPGFYCENTTDKPTAKCQDTTVKTLAKLYASTGKCYDKCFKNERNEYIPEGSCEPPSSDPATDQCISYAQTKAIAAVNKGCFVAPAVAPACWGSIPAADWVNLLSIVSDGTFPEFYCFE